MAFGFPASVEGYQHNPEETALVNSVGTRNALIFAKEHNARFLLPQPVRCMEIQKNIRKKKCTGGM